MWWILLIHGRFIIRILLIGWQSWKAGVWASFLQETTRSVLSQRLNDLLMRVDRLIRRIPRACVTDLHQMTRIVAKPGEAGISVRGIIHDVMVVVGETRFRCRRFLRIAKMAQPPQVP